MMKFLVRSLLFISFAAMAETNEVNSALCEPVLKVPGPLATTLEQCYNFAKSRLKKDPKNPGNAERYLEIAKKDKKANKECVRVIRDVSREVRKAGLRDDELFLKPSTAKGESRATLDEMFYFHGECMGLAKEALKSVPKAAAEPASAPASTPTK